MPTIKLKRSATQNAVPSTSQLGLGEVALNTYDGKMFIKKSVGGTESIVEIGGDATSSSGLDFTGNLNLADNVRIVIGDGNDLQIWHGGVDSYITNDFGHLQLIQKANDKDIQFYSDDGSGGHVEYLRMDGALGYTVASKHILFNDNVKARFGNSADLQIVHDGSNSYIDDGGTGSLLIRGSEVVLGNGGKKGVRVIADGAVQIRHNDSTKIETTSAGATVTGDITLTGNVFTDEGFYGNRVWNEDNTSLRFATNNTERMRIDASGRLLVNTTSSIDNLAKIQVVGDSSSLARITLQDVDGTNQKTFFEQSGGGTRISTQDGTSNGFFTIGAWNGTASSDFVRVTSAGRVGIGTTAPEHPLHVSFSGDNGAQIKSTDNHASLYINAASGYGSYIRFEENNAQNYWINAATDGSLRFRPAGGSSNWVVFGSTGQVGIGTATPSRQLHILKSGTTSAIMIEAGDGSQSSVDLKNTEGWFRLINDGGAFSVYDQSDSAERFRIDTSGNVGIGITNPSTPLAVQSNSSAQGITILGRSTDDISQLDFVENDGTSIAGFQARTTDFRIRSVQNLPLLFMTNNTERVRIHNNGQLGIGVTNFTSALRGNGKQLIIGSCFVGTGAALVADDFARFGGALYIHEDAGTNSANVTSLDNNGDRLVITGKQGTTANALDAPDGFYVGGTQFITSSRQITNVTSITATGAISTTGNATIGGETKTDSLLVENPSTIGHTAIGSISNDGGSGYIRSSIVMTRDEDQITYNGSTDTWTHAGGSSTDWSMITHSANAGFQVYSGAAVSSSTNYTHSQFNDAYRHFQITAAGKALFYGNVQIDGTLQGPATFTIDPASYGDNTGTVVIAGNLQVDGTTTTINSTTLTVDDKNITLASGSTNAAAANGAGLTVDCGSDTDATLTYVSTTDDWKFDKPTRVSGLSNAGIAFTSTETLVDGSSALPNGRIFYHSSRLIYDSPSSGHRFAVAGNQGTNLALEIYSNRDIGFYNSSGAADLFWDASTARLGIGTTAPLDLLHLSSSSGDVRQLLDAPTGSDAEIKFSENGTVKYTIGHDAGSSNFVIGTTNVDTEQRFVINSSGNVGIGTSPSYPLEVSGAGTVTIAYQRTGVSGPKKWGFHSDSSNTYWQNLTDNVFGLTVSNAGRIGIGTLSPAAKLHISGNSDISDEDCMLIIDDVDGSAGSRIPAIMFRSNTGGTVTNQARIRGHDTQGMVLSGSSALGNDLVVQSGGVGIGTTSPEGLLHFADSSEYAIVFDHVGQEKFKLRHGTSGLYFTGPNTNTLAFGIDHNHDVRVFNTSGSAYAAFDGSTSRFAVGTTTPGRTFHVASSDYSVARLERTGAGGGVALEFRNGDGNIWQIGNDGDEVLRFYYAGTNRLQITSTGATRINSAYTLPTADGSANQVLKTDGSGNLSFVTIAGAGAITEIEDADGDTKIQVEESSDEDKIRFDIAGTEKVILDSSNFSIESGGFRVNDPGNNYPFAITQYGYMTTRGSSITQLNGTDHANVPLSVLADVNTTRTASYVEIGDIGSAGNRFKIDASGNVGIGDTSPSVQVPLTIYYSPTSRFHIGGAQAGISNNVYYNGSAYTNRDTSVGGALLQIATNGSFAFRRATSGSSPTLNYSMYIDSLGKVGIGTTSPAAALDITQANARGAYLRSSTTGSRLHFLDATTASVTTVGVGAEGNNLVLHGGGAEFMRVASSGNVGIGTTSPNSYSNQKVLTINGTTHSRIDFETADTLRGSIYGDSGSLNLDAGGNYLRFYAGNTQKMTLLANGNLGINETNPSHRLQVSVDADGAFIKRDVASNAANLSEFNSHRSLLLLNRNAGSYLAFGGNGSRTDIQATDLAGTPTAKIINLNPFGGNVGIGTTSPSAPLHLKGTGDTTLIVEADSDNSGETDNARIELRQDGNNVAGYLYTEGNAGQTATGTLANTTVLESKGAGNDVGIHFATGGRAPAQSGGELAGTVRMTILGSGNVGIGTTSPADKLHISGGNLLLNNALEIRTKDTGGNVRTVLRANSSNELEYGWSANAPVKFMGGGSYTERMRIHTNGNIGIGTTAPDAKLQVEELGIDTTTTSTTATTQVAIDTMAAATFRSAEFTIQVTNSTDSTYHMTKVLLIHDGTTPGITEYGTVFTGSAAEATFDADISSGNVRLLATPASTDSMTFKVVRHCITV